MSCLTLIKLDACLRIRNSEHLPPRSAFSTVCTDSLYALALGSLTTTCLRCEAENREDCIPLQLIYWRLMENNSWLLPGARPQWVRNAEASREVTLKKGRPTRRFRLRPLDGPEKLQVLKAYLDRFQREVQTYFLVPAGYSPEAFESIAQNYPAFELAPF